MPALVSWSNPLGGDWDTANNWSGGALPGPGDDVVINIAVSNPITHAQNLADSINSLSASDPVNLSNGTLNVASTLSSSSTFTLAGGTLGQATVAAGTTLTGTSSGGALDGVTLNGNLDLATNSGHVDLGGGLTLTGTITLGNGGATTASFLRTYGTQTLGGDGSVVFGAAGGYMNRVLVMTGTLTLGPSFLVHGQNGIVEGSFADQGTVDADTAGGNIGLSGAWTSSGSLEATNGGTLTLGTGVQDTWSNTGTISETNSTLNLGGNFTTAGLGMLTRSGGTVNLIGILNNTASTLTLNATTGAWDLTSSNQEGTIEGGTVKEVGGDYLQATSAGGLLSGITLNGDLDLASVSAHLDMTNGLTLNGTIYLGNTNGTTGSFMRSYGTETLGGSGTIVFGAAAGDSNRVSIQSGTLTLPPGFLVHGQNGGIEGSFVNEGTIDADTSGGTILLTGSFSSSGSLEAQPGTTLYLGVGPQDTWTNTGPITVNNAKLNLNGTWRNTSTITQVGSTVGLGGSVNASGLGTIMSTNGILNLVGTLTNDTGLTLNNSTGPLYLAGGIIKGGTVTTSGNAALIVAPQTQNTLNGITLAGTLEVGFIGRDTLTVTGGLTLSNGAIEVEGFGLITFMGSQAVGGAGTVSFADSDTRKDLAVPNATDTLTIGQGVTITGIGGTIGSKQGGFVTIDGGIQVNSGGTIIVYQDTNYSNGTLTGGTWQAVQNSTLDLVGGGVITNAANILLDGASSAIDSDQNNTNALTNLSSNEAGASFTVQNGNTFQAPAAFSNAGTVTIGAGAQFKLSSTYTQTQGTTYLDGGTLGSSASDTVTIQSGGLSGPGTINANLTNNGSMDLGTSPGTLTVIGSYTQESAASLTIKVGGTTPGMQYDQVNVSGSASLDGTLNINLINGFGPTIGQSFPIINFASSSGNFAKVNGLVQNGVTTLLAILNPTSFTLKAVTTGPDLAPQSITLPSGTQVPGQPVTISFQVANVGGTALNGNWVDSVFLSTSTSLNASAMSIGQVQHMGGLAVNSSYTASLTAPLPAVMNGSYFVLVEADSQLLTQDSNRSNNVLASASHMTVAVPVLTSGNPVSGTIASGQELYYQAVITPGQDGQLTATFQTAQEADFLVGYFKLPTRSSFDLSYPNLSDKNQQLILSGSNAGNYYVLLHGESGAGNGQPYTVELQAAPFQIQSFTIGAGPGQGQTSLELTGSGFTPQTTVQLLDANNNTFPAISTIFVDSDHAVAAFDLTMVPQGTYTVEAINGAERTTAASPFTNQPVVAGQPTIKLFTAPTIVNVQQPVQVTLGLANQTNHDIVAPTLQITGTNVNIYPQPLVVYATSGTPGYHELGENATGPASLTPILQPGYFGVFTFEFEPTPDIPDTTSMITLSEAGADEPINWASQKSALRPSFIQPDAWEAIYANYTAALGNTVGSMQQVLWNDSTYLAELGESVTSVPQLLGFELMKADDSIPSPVLTSAVDSYFPSPGLLLTFERTYVQSLSGRYHLGTLGRGWVSNWDISASTDTAGNVVVQQGATERFFTHQLNGTYQAAPGDFGTLMLINGAYALREKDGTVTAFLPNGQLSYVEDANGNSITAGYTKGLLTSLTDSDGDQMTLSYNSQELISQVTDPAGRVATYTYDGGGQYLLSVTTPTGTSQYSYLTGQGIELNNALQTITNPDGRHQYFSYDAQGRLSQRYEDNGNNLITYTYFTPGGYGATNADGNTTTILYDVNGLPAAITNAVGDVEMIHYDANGQPILMGPSGGPVTSMSYDSQGNLNLLTDPLGNASQFTSNPQFAGMQSFTNALGATTNYGYTSQGDLASIMQPDGSASQYVYNSQGEVAQSIDAMGRVTDYIYDARGQLTQRDNPDGTTITLSYDSFGNLLSVTDASGTISLSYNSASQLIEVAYPNGEYLKYGYDALGRRTQISDQSGFTENYTYDSPGQLTQVTDAQGNLIASYNYNAAGQLIDEQHGNSTYTTYAYDDAGQLLHLVNYAPDNSVNSRFDYTYDAVGQVTSMTTLAGTTTYGYDPDGQLISVVLPGGRTIAYAYDAMGNRTVVSDSGGTTTDYMTNELNQYTEVGADAYGYDADGNLIVTTGPDGKTTYTYDDQDRLICVQTPTDTWSYSYDVLGNMVASTHNGQRTHYLVDPTGLGSIVGEYDGSGNLMANYTYGIGLTSQVSASGTAAYYDFDATGNTAGLSSHAGVYVSSYSYLPFGEIQSSMGDKTNSFQYGGKYGVMATGNGLSFMRARFYTSANGRFISSDPIGLIGGVNLYRYARNNPISFGDPAGLAPPNLNPDGSTQAYVTRQGVSTISQAAQDFFDGKINAGQYLSGSATQVADEAEENPGWWAGFVGAVGAGWEWIVGGGITAAAGALLTNPVFWGAVDLAIWGYFGYLLYDTLGPNSKLYTRDSKVPVWTAADVASLSVTVVGSHDPNFLSGPAGFGPQQFVSGSSVLPYAIGFSNEPNATAPAQVVTLTQQLDANLDWSTFQLGDFGFGGQTYSAPAGLQYFHTRIDVRSKVGVYVDVTADFNSQTGQLTWTFTSIDPTTLAQPTGNPEEGFLPPDVTAPDGEGWVSYRVLPKASDSTGTIINAQATVVFDYNAPINTENSTNTIDSGPPASSVLPLPATTPSLGFDVTWSGQDDAGGSGIAFYNIYVADDGGPFMPWLARTTQTSALYTGQNGHTYSFYSVATDNVGNQQATPTSAQATTTINQQAATFVVNGPTTATAGQGFIITVQAEDASDYPVPTFSGMVSLTTSDPQGSVLLPIAMTNGFGVSLATLATVAGGPWTVSASSGSISGTSAPITVTSGPPIKLGFSTQPVSTPTGVTLPPVTVQLLDEYGNVVTSDNTDSVTLGVASGPGSFLPGSTATATFHSGVATFSNLTLVTPGSYSLSAVVPQFYSGANSQAFSVAPLQVLPGSFVSTTTGFSLQFNAPFLVNSVTPVLFGQGFGATAPVPSVTLTQTRDAHGNPITPVPVEGSVILNAAGNSITFVETDTARLVNSGTPILPDGTYVADITSSAAHDGFQALDPGGGFLDGLASGAAGSGDYTATFMVNAATAEDDVLWVPATADGPGQALSAPGQNQVGAGYPVYLDDITGMVTSVQATLTYNPSLLTVTPTSTATFTVKVPMPGTAVLQYSGAALAAGAQTPIGFITATVPSGTPVNPMPYKAKDLLALSAVSLNGGALAGVGSATVHLVAYVGDADGSGSYSSNDAVLITRALLNTDSGFTAYPLVDPLIVADTDGAGFIPADAALQVNEAGAGLPTANLANPAIPSGVVFQAAESRRLVDQFFQALDRGPAANLGHSRVPDDAAAHRPLLPTARSQAAVEHAALDECFSGMILDEDGFCLSLDMAARHISGYGFTRTHRIAGH